MDNTEELYSNAQTAFINERYDQSIKLLSEAIKVSPLEVKYYTLLGNSYLVQNKFKESEAYFEKAARLQPKNGERYFDYGNALLGQERFSEAMAQYGEALRLGCSSSAMRKIYYIMALLDQSEGKFDEALINFDKAERIPGQNSDAIDIFLQRIQIYLRQDDLDNAENCAIQLKLLRPKDFNSYQLLFQIYIKKNSLQKASDTLKEAENYCESTVESRVETNFDKAMILCKKAEKAGEKANSLYNEALVFLKDVEKITGVSNADKVEAQVTSAEILMNIGEYKKAQENAQKIAVMKSEDLKEYVERAHYIIVTSAGCEDDYETVLKYAPILKTSENVFYRHYGYYTYAYSLKKMAEKKADLKNEADRTYDMLIAYYKNCTLITPGDFVAYLFRAKAYVDMGKSDKAMEILQILPEDSQKTLREYIEKNR